MADTHPIKAPDGWLDYATGAHFAGQAPAANGDYLNFLKRLDLGVAEPVSMATMETDGRFSWQDAENAAMARAARGEGHLAAQISALRGVAARFQAPDAPQTDDWTRRVAEGRLYLNLVQALQRNQDPEALHRADILLDKARRAFSGLEGEDFFQAQRHVIKGRLLAWKNDIIGATANQSSALSTFRKYNNIFREADAAYELAMANLDANLPGPALPLFELAIQAHRTLGRDGGALGRSLQAKARTLLVSARQAAPEEAGGLIEDAEAHALEAFLLSAPDQDVGAVEKLAGRAAPSEPAGLAVSAPFRAGMAARDLAEAALLRHRCAAAPADDALPRAKDWFKIAAEQLGFEEIFSETGRRSMRQAISGTDTVAFDVLRIAQLEFEILAETAPDQAATLLIETGKRFENKAYTIECFTSAARCFAIAADRTGDDALHNEAIYWQSRAGRLALSIGYRFQSSLDVPATASEALREAFDEVSTAQAFDVLQFETAREDLLRAEIVLSGRQTVSRLIILPASKRTAIDMTALSAISQRGDIAQIVTSGETENECLYLIEEIAVGRRLSDALQTPMPFAARVRLAARLCRTVAGLIRAFGGKTGNGSPLYLTMDDIILEPGHRGLVTNIGPLTDKQAPATGWSFLYDGVDAKQARLSDGHDANALARMLIILFGIESIAPGNLWRGSYLRRALPLKSKPLDALSLKAVGALAKLANGKLKVKRSFERSDATSATAGPRSIKGVSELLYLASLLDSSAHKSSRKS